LGQETCQNNSFFWGGVKKTVEERAQNSMLPTSRFQEEMFQKMSFPVFLVATLSLGLVFNIGWLNVLSSSGAI